MCSIHLFGTKIKGGRYERRIYQSIFNIDPYSKGNDEKTGEPFLTKFEVGDMVTLILRKGNSVSGEIEEIGDKSALLTKINGKQELFPYSIIIGYDVPQKSSKKEERNWLKQYHDDAKTPWNYFTSADGKICNNPCNCGSNLYHQVYDGTRIYCVCNSCKEVIYEVKDEYIKGELAKGVWQ